jgi:hypothetical protein
VVQLRTWRQHAAWWRTPLCRHSHQKRAACSAQLGSRRSIQRWQWWHGCCFHRAQGAVQCVCPLLCALLTCSARRAACPSAADPPPASAHGRSQRGPCSPLPTLQRCLLGAPPRLALARKVG